jgi:hypothetical protein
MRFILNKHQKLIKQKKIYYHIFIKVNTCLLSIKNIFEYTKIFLDNIKIKNFQIF